MNSAIGPRPVILVAHCRWTRSGHLIHQHTCIFFLGGTGTWVFPSHLMQPSKNCPIKWSLFGPTLQGPEIPMATAMLLGPVTTVTAPTLRFMGWILSLQA